MNIPGVAAIAGLGGSLASWLVVAGLVALGTATGAGMYAGAMIERGRHAREIGNIKDAQIAALDQAARRLKEAQDRGDEVSGRFEQALRNIRIENRTFQKETRVETEKLVYTDCKVPDSGIDMLKRKADAVNLLLIGKEKK